MKIRDILREQEDWKQDSPEFRTKQSGFNPETGQYTWDVEYTPLKGVDKAIEDAFQEYKDVLKKYPEDQKLEKLFDVFAAWKREFRKHVSRKYGK